MSATAWTLTTASGAQAWAWPADGDVLREFSLGDNPYAGGQHRGVDVALGGTRMVRAPVSGKVAFAGQVPTSGLTVTILAADGHKVSLTHLGPLLVKRDELVAEGGSVAEAGPSGTVEHEVPYVHLGVRIGDEGTYVDPLSLLPPRAAPIPPPASAAPPAPAPPPATPPPAPELPTAEAPPVTVSETALAPMPTPIATSAPAGASAPEEPRVLAAVAPADGPEVRSGLIADIAAETSSARTKA
ncbi:MAG: M23 family metallopeptidase, partial [Actinobacteria bacterium]|nr:M23 family metallopeptidase [Actinomycetota bacterium]